MDKEQALSLIEELGGDEHSWVDYKEDYEVGGIKYHKAEFAKDIASFANTITDQDSHYIFVGCSEEEGVVGVDFDSNDGMESEDEESEIEEDEDEGNDEESPRHILSFDESDLQETINEYLTPTPEFTLHTFETEDGDIAVIEITPADNPPSVVEKRIHDANNTYLHEGLVYVRGGSGKRIAVNEDVENIIQHRIEARREFLTEGLRRVVDLGPEFLMEMGTIGPEEEAEFTIAPDEEGDLTVTSALTHPIAFSGPQEEIYSDLSKWQHRDSYSCDLESLYYYYANQSDFEKTDEALRFLFESSLSHWIPGIYWLTFLDEEKRLELLEEVPDEHPCRRVVCKILLLMGEDDFLEEYVEDSDSIDPQGQSILKYRRLAGTYSDGASGMPVDERWEEILSVKSNVDYDGLELSHNLEELDQDEIRDLIPQAAEKLRKLETKQNLSQNEENARNNLKYWLVNLEIVLGREIL